MRQSEVLDSSETTRMGVSLQPRATVHNHLACHFGPLYGINASSLFGVGSDSQSRG